MMYRLTILKASLLALSLGLSAGAAQASTNLLSDGDFESFSSQVANGGYTVVGGGNSIGAWLVGATSVDLIRNAHGSIDNVSVDLAGSPGPGSLSQGFSAVAGTVYTLSFDYFKNGPGTAMAVSFGGQNYSFTPGAAAASQTLTWTATTTGAQTVMFGSGSGTGGPTLDNVLLTAAPVPEPSSMALLLAGVSVLGFVARRRKRG